MRTAVEHPDDIAARVAYRDELRICRIDRGLSAEAVSRLAGFACPSAVRDMEDDPTWMLWRAQQWARGLGKQGRLSLAGLTVPDRDITALVLAFTVAFGGLDEDNLLLRIVAHDLVRTRKAIGVTRAELARTCGWSVRSVAEFEINPSRSWLRTWQRHSRGLGGRLTLQLMPAGAQVPA